MNYFASWGFLCVRDAGRRGNKITVFLLFSFLKKQQFFIVISMLNLLQETSHLELKQTSMLSAVASLTPFSDFNQSPRNMYQCQVSLLIETSIVLGICS